MVRTTYKLKQIIQAEGWYAKFKNLEENKGQGYDGHEEHYRYERLLAFGIFESSDGDVFFDGLTECSMSNPVENENNFISLAYRPEETVEIFSDNKGYVPEEAP